VATISGLIGANEDLVLTVGIELSAFKRAKIKNRQTSQQYSQQLFRNECCPSLVAVNFKSNDYQIIRFLEQSLKTTVFLGGE